MWRMVVTMMGHVGRSTLPLGQALVKHKTDAASLHVKEGSATSLGKLKGAEWGGCSARFGHQVRWQTSAQGQQRQQRTAADLHLQQKHPQQPGSRGTGGADQYQHSHTASDPAAKQQERPAPHAPKPAWPSTAGSLPKQQRGKHNSSQAVWQTNGPDHSAQQQQRQQGADGSVHRIQQTLQGTASHQLPSAQSTKPVAQSQKAKVGQDSFRGERSRPAVVEVAAEHPGSATQQNGTARTAVLQSQKPRPKFGKSDTSVSQPRLAEQTVPTGMSSTLVQPTQKVAATPAELSSKANTSSSVAPSTASESGVARSLQASRSDAATGGKVPLRDLLHAQGIVMRTYAPGQHNALVCPQCQGGSSKEKSLNLNISDDGQVAQWQCHRASCGYKGGVSTEADATRTRGADGKAHGKKDIPPVRPDPNLQPLGPNIVEFFSKRGISRATLERCGVAQEELFSPPLQRKTTAIAFPYRRNGEILNVKYRTLEKRFWQVKGAEKVMYGLDDVVGQSEIIIVEGEIDKLALAEAGIDNVLSVPDGAPQRAKEGDLPPPNEDVKYSYLWNCRGELDGAGRIVLATDNDAPGNALAEELARRLGRERCWRVRWPSGSVDGSPLHRKDANEVLMKDGPKALVDLLDAADPYPIRGLFRFSDFFDDIKSYYNLESSDGQALSSGWKGLDDIYKVVPGELTIVTGVPNSGKSEWIDALLCNLAEQQGWSFALCSMEKKVTDHARQLLEKYFGEPFFELKYSQGHSRMPWPRIEQGLEWLDECFHLIRYEDEELPSIDWVLDLARAAVLRYGIRGLVIDPYNELDHQRPTHMNETEYVSQMLTKIKRFAQHHDVHVWFVAHPRQMRDWKGEPPNLYDISGSAHFINKADNGIVVHRNYDPDRASNEVKILVRKVRNKAAGTIGDCLLRYNRTTGRYEDLPKPDDYHAMRSLTAADVAGRAGAEPGTRQSGFGAQEGQVATYIHNFARV